jgi:hypothetical protein
MTINYSIKDLLDTLPREIVLLIFSFTTEFARRYSRHLGFKMFGAPNNIIFPIGFFKIAPHLTPKDAHKLWKMERKLYCITKEKQYFLKDKTKRPCLQHSFNSSHDFKERVFPNIHYNNANGIWNVTNYKKLISYSLKVTLSNYYTLLIINKSDFELFKSLFASRMFRHNMNIYLRDYIVYYNKHKKDFDRKLRSNTVPRIMCVPLNYQKIKNVGPYLELLRNHNIKSYVISPYTVNNKINDAISQITKLSNGSGVYSLES